MTDMAPNLSRFFFSANVKAVEKPPAAPVPRTAKERLRQQELEAEARAESVRREGRKIENLARRLWASRRDNHYAQAIRRIYIQEDR